MRLRQGPLVAHSVSGFPLPLRCAVAVVGYEHGFVAREARRRVLSTTGEVVERDIESIGDTDNCR